MTQMTRLSLTFVAALVGSAADPVLAVMQGPAAPGYAQAEKAGHDAGTIVDRFLSRADMPLLQYRGSRRLEARNARFKMTGWLEVETELAAGVFSYRVVS